MRFNKLNWNRDLFLLPTGREGGGEEEEASRKVVATRQVPGWKSTKRFTTSITWTPRGSVNTWPDEPGQLYKVQRENARELSIAPAHRSRGWKHSVATSIILLAVSYVTAVYRKRNEDLFVKWKRPSSSLE